MTEYGEFLTIRPSAGGIARQGRGSVHELERRQARLGDLRRAHGGVHIDPRPAVDQDAPDASQVQAVLVLVPMQVVCVYQAPRWQARPTRDWVYRRR